MKQKLHIPILLLSLCSLFCTLPASAGISSVSVTQNANCTGRGNQYEPILSALITVTGDAAELTSVDITLDGTTDINDYEKVKILPSRLSLLRDHPQRIAAPDLIQLPLGQPLLLQGVP